MTTFYSPGYHTGHDQIETDDETIHENLESRYEHHNYDAIALGCSFTSGLCIPPEHSWPHIIEQLTGQRIITIASTGVGLNWLWNIYIRFVTTYGNPQHLYLLTPDLKRLRFKSNQTLNNPNDHQLNWEERTSSYRDWGNKKANIKQHNGKTTPINTTLATSINLTSLDNLHHHTTQNNITFTHTTWWHPTHNTLTKLNYPNYTPLNYTCNHQPQTQQQHHWWNHSTDGHHGGLHDQIHFAQTLLKTHITNEQLQHL